MPKRIVGADGNDWHVGSHPHPDASASVMGNLQQVDEGNVGQRQFEISGEERGLAAASKQQDNGVVVFGGSPHSPSPRRVQDGPRTQLVAGNDKAERYASLLGQLNKGAIGRDHRIAAQPQFSDFKVPYDVEEPGEVIVVRMGERDSIQPTNAAGKKVGTHDIL